MIIPEAYMEAGPKNRAYLSLESGLPNEVDWAFNALVMISFYARENFLLSKMPTLIGTLIKHGHNALDEIGLASEFFFFILESG